MSDAFITPDWPVSARVHAAVTTRLGGVSSPPFDSFNLATHVDDAPQAVAANRRLLVEQLHLPNEPRWLEQVHGVEALRADGLQQLACADASFTAQAGVVCVVLTADCLPILLAAEDGSEVAAIHAGWRGLAGGVIEQCLRRMQTPPPRLQAWLGPAIGPEVFEVGDEVRQQFLALDAAADSAFRPSAAGRWLADLFELARQRLAKAGVAGTHGGGLCTFSDPQRFYSYRRHARTGRMASLIWLE